MLVLCVPALAGGCSGGPAPAVTAPSGPPAATAPSSATASGAVTASAVLHRWDRARARAYATGDVAALSRLYAPASAAGTADVRVLEGYLRRGLRVEGMRMQLLAVEELDRDGRRLVLRVTDRLADGAAAVGEATTVRLPSDTASTRVVELVRAGGRWRVASVSDRVPRTAGP